MKRSDGRRTAHAKTGTVPKRRLIRREVVLDHRYLKLALDTERTPDGREHTYIHGTGPAIAYAVPVWPDGAVTLNVQRRHGMKRPSVEVPGGHVDPGESPAAAAKRELREETGLVARRVVPVLACLISIKVQQEMHVFLAQGLRAGRHDRDPDEEIECIRLPLDEAIRRGLHGWIRHGPSLLALFAARERLLRSSVRP